MWTRNSKARSVLEYRNHKIVKHRSIGNSLVKLCIFYSYDTKTSQRPKNILMLVSKTFYIGLKWKLLRPFFSKWENLSHCSTKLIHVCKITATCTWLQGEQIFWVNKWYTYFLILGMAFFVICNFGHDWKKSPW